MGRSLLFVLTFVVLLWGLRTLVRAGSPRVASRSVTAKGARTLVRVVCWAALVNISAICAYGVATTADGDAGRTLKMVTVGLVLIATVPVLILRRLPVPASSRRHRPATEKPARRAEETTTRSGRSSGLAERLRDLTSRPVE
jgi:hypothetical protein